MTNADFLRDFEGAPPPAGLRERVLAAAAERPRRRLLAAAAVLVPLLVAANALFESWTTEALGARHLPAVTAVVPVGRPQPLAHATADSWSELRRHLGGGES